MSQTSNDQGDIMGEIELGVMSSANTSQEKTNSTYSPEIELIEFNLNNSVAQMQNHNFLNMDEKDGSNEQFWINRSINSGQSEEEIIPIDEKSYQKLENIDRMISFTMSGTSEGSARLDQQYYTGEFLGLGLKRQYLLNYKFIGLFEEDEPKIGYLSSPFMDIIGQLNDYQIISGRVRLKFAQGFILEGFFNKQTFSGLGVLSNYLTGFRIESEFKNGVCLNDPTWALVHGDNKQKMHRFCLAKIDQDFTPNSEDEDSATNNSSENVYEPEVLDKYMPAPLKKKGI